MKQRIAIAMVALWLMLSCHTAVAASAVSENEKTVSIGVYVRVENRVEGEYSAEIKNGHAHVTVGDMTVSASKVPRGAVRMVLVPIPESEEEAWDWFASCTDGLGTPRYAFELYFTDVRGDRLEAAEASVTVAYSDGTETPTVWSLATDGTVGTPYSEKGTFTAGNAAYYLLGKQLAAPVIIEGHGQSVEHGVAQALRFSSDAEFRHFLRVELDGKTLGNKHYTVSEGSTVVTLSGAYVSGLSVGEHTLGIVSKNGTADTTFTVERAVTDSGTDEVPKTGETIPRRLWVAMLLMSGCGAIVLTAYHCRRKRA